MHSILESGYDLEGFLLTLKDTANTHFATHEIQEEALQENFIVNVVNSALMSLKSRFNLTKSQLRTCISRENITADSICKPKNVTCDPSKIR